MSAARIPAEHWGWRSSGVILLVILTPILLLGLVGSEGHRLTDAVRLDGLITFPAMLVAALASYASWRLQPLPVFGWLTLVTTVISLQAMTVTGIQLLGNEAARAHPAFSTLFDMGIVTMVVVCWILARNRGLRGDPGVVGLLVGLVLAAARLVVVTVVPASPHTEIDPLALIPFFIGLNIVIVVLARSTQLFEPWIQHRFAVAVAAFSCGTLSRGNLDGELGAGLTIACDVVHAGVLASTALALLQMQVDRHRHEIDQLNDLLVVVGADLREGRARLHELNSTIAGITSASRLVHMTPDLSLQRRRALEEMIDAELARLQRLLEPASDRDAAHTVDLDATISRLVVSQEARGNTVRWEPSGQRATGHPDAVAEVLHILLDNAAKHGASGACVEVRRLDEKVEIAVTDSGPGLAPEVHGRLFEWGSRGGGSRGQGIGLHIARDLMQRQGGYLELRPSSGKGTTFVAGLKAARDRSSDDAAAHLS